MMYTKRISKYLVVTAVSLAAVFSEPVDAQVEYIYTGNNLSSFSCGGNTTCSVPDPQFTSYTTDNFVQASITFDSPLPPNLSLADVRVLPGFLLTIGDGIQQLGFPDEVFISTDGDGNIVAPWSVISNGPVPPNNGVATLNWEGGRGVGDVATLSAPTGGTPNTVRDQGYSNNPGAWTRGVPQIVDLDIKRFDIEKNKIGTKCKREQKPRRVTLTVVNNGDFDEPRLATVVGYLSGLPRVEFYAAEMMISAPVGADDTRWKFPSYVYPGQGTFWEATIQDDDPDVDFATRIVDIIGSSCS